MQDFWNHFFACFFAKKRHKSIVRHFAVKLQEAGETLSLVMDLETPLTEADNSKTNKVLPATDSDPCFCDKNLYFLIRALEVLFSRLSLTKRMIASNQIKDTASPSARYSRFLDDVVKLIVGEVDFANFEDRWTLGNSSAILFTTIDKLTLHLYQQIQNVFKFETSMRLCNEFLKEKVLRRSFRSRGYLKQVEADRQYIVRVRKIIGDSVLVRANYFPKTRILGFSLLTNKPSLKPDHAS